MKKIVLTTVTATALVATSTLAFLSLKGNDQSITLNPSNPNVGEENQRPNLPNIGSPIFVPSVTPNNPELIPSTPDYTTPDYSNQTPTTPNRPVDVVTNGKQATENITFLVTPVGTLRNSMGVEETIYDIVINGKSDRGTVHFLKNGKLEEKIQAKPGEKVQLKIVPNEGYSVERVKVYGDSQSIMLAADKLADNVFEFEIPSPKITNPVTGEQMDNSFQVTGGKITVEATFTLTNLGLWTYEYDRNGHGTYTLDIQEDLLLDDSVEGLTLKSLKDYENTRFKIKMNGHNVKVGRFTIPSGCDLILENTTNKDSKFMVAEGKEGIIHFEGVLYQQNYKIYNEGVKTHRGEIFYFVNN